MTRKFKVEMYNCAVVFHIEDDKHALKALYKKLNKKYKLGEEGDGFFEGMVFSTKNEFHILIAKDKASTNTISHECFHLCVKIFQFNNIAIETEEESFALLTGWMNEKITNLAYNHCNSNTINSIRTTRNTTKSLLLQQEVSGEKDSIRTEVSSG